MDAGGEGMAEKKPPNWAEIETRYCVHGEKPEDIVKDYNVAAQTIYHRASKGGWKQKQAEIGRELRLAEIERRKSIMSKVGRILDRMTDDMLNALEMHEMGVTVQDGEGFPNKYYLEAWRSLASNYAKPVEDKPEDEQTASRPVYQSVYTTSEPHTAPDGDP